MSNWKLDTVHTAAEFKVKHMGLSWVTGHVFGVTGEIEFDPENPESASYSGVLDVSTLTTGDKKRDGHLMSDDFFDVANHPEITFKSTEVKVMGGEEETATVKGELTIAGVTKEVELLVSFLGVAERPNQDGGSDKVAGFLLNSKIDRTEFGLDWNMPLPGGNMLVGNYVDIRIDIQAVEQA